jgi:hypothetical protein
MLSAADRLAEELGEDEPRRTTSGRAASDGLFSRVNALDTIAVLDFCGIEHDEKFATCPGCGEEGALICKDGGVKCLHNRCANAGPASYPGFRSNVDIVAQQKSVEPLVAAKVLAEHFGIPMPERNNGSGNGARNCGHTDPPPDDDWTPSDNDSPDAPPCDDQAPPRPGKDEPPYIVLEADAIFAPVPPIAWIVQGLDLCPGAPAMLAGYGYGGKSIAAQAAAIDISGGRLVWGTFGGVLGRVVHIDYEQGENLTRRRYHRLLHGADLTPADVQGRLALVCHPSIYLDDALAESMLLGLLDGATLCLVDSLRAAAPRLEENSSDARRVLDLLGRVSERTRCTILVIHHARKANPNATSSIRESIRGSGALYDACGSVLVVEGNPGEDARTIHHVKARVSGKLADPMSLHIDDSEGGGLVVSVTAAPTAEEKERDQHRRRVDRLVSELRDLFGRETEQGGVDSISAKLGRKSANVRQALRVLIDSGEVVATGSTRDRKHHLAEGRE